MAEQTDFDGLTQLGVAANLANRYAADQRDFVDYLAAMLENVLPDQTVIKRGGKLFGPKQLQAISVTLDDYVYSQEIPNRGALLANRTKVVRGIKLKTEVLPMEAWLTLLSEQIAECARMNKEASHALQKLIGG